ncbi:DUF2834 domain-containing protein [Vibrio aquaticus]|uniref:DUF2834 domain-containing protein n=1 Tax=Vibrio aquaticus TaxID=2496559 RepID=A0A432CT38_9VIBR|nr:DUF2834 domain-containing protein [Vibrio aquaticus]RTZ14404.1 DUF2834 domain-containing protein [Vibrio aquaticus]
MKIFYLALTIFGVLIPYGALLPWLMENGLNIPYLIQQAAANSVGLFAWLDVLVSAVALLGFILVDGARNYIKFRYVAVIGTLKVGVSCGLPLYLYLKERQLNYCLC